MPSRHASREELIELAAVCREFPGTSLEFMPQVGPAPFTDEVVELMSAMSAAANRPLNWNLVQVVEGNAEQVEGKLRAGDHARRHGGRVVALVMPTRLSARFNFRSGFALDMLPGWAPVMALDLHDKLLVMRDDERRRDLEESARRGPPMLNAWSDYQIIETFDPALKRYEGQLVLDIARAEEREPFDVLVDIACADQLRTTFGRALPSDTAADWAARAGVIRDERTIVGGSDAGAHLDMIGTFTYTTRLLADGVRGHGVMTTEEAVHHLTAAPADFYGIRDRGRIAGGAAADIVIFDEATVGSAPLATRADLPGDEARLYAEATGIEHVLVNGVSIVERGSFTEHRPGRIIRSGRDTSTPAMA